MHFLFSCSSFGSTLKVYTMVYGNRDFDSIKTSLVSEFDVLLKQQLLWLKHALRPDSSSPKNYNFTKPKWI